MIVSKKSKYIYIFFSGIILAITSLALFMILRPHILFSTSDIQFHIRRVMELKDDILNGQFLPTYSFNYFHGSLVMGMYPYLSVYPLAILIILSHSVIVSYYVFFCVNLYLSFLVCFFSSYKYNKKILRSYIFAILYETSSVFIFIFNIAGDLGLFTSLVFLPIAIFSFLNIIRNKSNHYLGLVMGLVLVAYCQLPAVIILMLILFIWLFININHITIVEFKTLLKSALLSIIFLGIIWIPIIYYSVSNSIYTVNLYPYLKSINIINFIKYMGIFSIIPIVISLIFFNKLNKIEKQMLIISIIIIILSTKIMPWRLVEYLPIIKHINVFQYTFRFLMIPHILICYLFSSIISKIILKFSNNKSDIIFLLFICLIIFGQLFSQYMVISKKNANHPVNFINCYYKKPSSYFLTSNRSISYLINKSFYGNSCSDYYVRASLPCINNIDNNKGVYGKNSLNIKHIGFNTFRFKNNINIRELILPFMSYNNEKLKIFLNSHYINYKVNDNHLIVIKNITRGNNRVTIKPYSNKCLVITRYLLLLLGLLWLLVYYYKYKLKMR